MESTTAIILGYLGVALMVGLSGVASCIGTSIAGMASVGAMKKNGGAFGSYMILSAIPGSQGLYGFVGYFIIKGFLTDSMTLLQGAAIFGAGLLTGLVCLASSYYQSKVCANGIAAIGNIPRVVRHPYGGCRVSDRGRDLNGRSGKSLRRAGHSGVPPCFFQGCGLNCTFIA
mgnify:CR=1 FL=1